MKGYGRTIVGRSTTERINRAWAALAIFRTFRATFLTVTDFPSDASLSCKASAFAAKVRFLAISASVDSDTFAQYWFLQMEEVPGLLFTASLMCHTAGHDLQSIRMDSDGREDLDTLSGFPPANSDVVPRALSLADYLSYVVPTCPTSSLISYLISPTLRWDRFISPGVILAKEWTGVERGIWFGANSFRLRAVNFTSFGLKTGGLLINNNPPPYGRQPMVDNHGRRLVMLKRLLSL